ncbi:hypothetical protein LCGC14_1066960 [marine sediment metagenome]|uniref:Glycosyltransferase n=2 Tax=root TaxID=1 RepID=A0A831VPQ2_9FLAO|nr:glycosyltransferase [Pricia antarctica]
MQVSYMPYRRYIFGVFALIPYLLIKNYENIDFTFSSQTLINGTLGLAKRIGLFKKGKIIVRESNTIFKLLDGYKLKVYTFFYSVGYKGSDLVICQTDYMKNELEASLPLLSEHLNLKTIANPFNFGDINKKSGEILPKFRGLKFLVAAGRLAPAKGFDILIDTFSEIRKNEPHLELIILGEGRDRIVLENQARRLGLDKYIHLPGYVQNIYAYFKHAEVCILSSRIEGFPNVLLQMMSQNNAIVATLSAGGIDEIPGIFTCPTENMPKLKEGIELALKSSLESNRVVFDTFLKTRTQTSFYQNIIEYSN